MAIITHVALASQGHRLLFSEQQRAQPNPVTPLHSNCHSEAMCSVGIVLLHFWLQQENPDLPPESKACVTSQISQCSFQNALV